ncbi:uncharacterized protein C22orf15 [Xenentodon cancila]
MFVTVLFGGLYSGALTSLYLSMISTIIDVTKIVLLTDGRTEMMNLNCRLINFIHHLKEKCGLDFKDCVDLMDSRGNVMNLEAERRSLAAASSVLAGRQSYVLLRVCRDDDSGGHKYVPLLNNYSQTHPELTVSWLYNAH